MNKNLFVGIDFSKKTFNAAILRPSEERTELSFIGEKVFTNDVEGAEAFIKWVNDVASLKGDFSGILVGGEDTGSHSIVLPSMLYSAGVDCSIQSALAIKSGVGKIIRTKSDTADARMIAEYFWRYQDSVRLYQPAPEAVEELSEIYALRKSISNDMVMQKNRVQELECRLKARPNSEVLQNGIKYLNEEIERMEKKIKHLTREMVKVIKGDKELKRLYIKLRSIPGIGEITATLLIVITRAFTRFDNAKQLACFCGVAPHLNQSGTSVQKGAHRSHYADSTISGTLHMAAMTAIKHNGRMRVYAERKKREGKHHLVIMNNVKNKMLAMAFSIATNNTTYDPEFLEKSSRA